MPEDDTTAGLIGLIVVSMITVFMVFAIVLNGDFPYFDDKMSIRVIDKFVDESTGTYYVNVDKVLTKNVTYIVGTENVYKDLDVGNGYTVIYNKTTKTIMGL